MPPTMDDVARRAQVSRALASLVFSGSPKVSAESRRKVLAAAADLGYRRNALARSLATKTPRTIGVHIQDITNPYFATVYLGVANAAANAGYDLLVGPGRGPVTGEPSLINTLIAHQVCGLILQSPYIEAELLADLLTGVPAVLIGREAAIDHVDVVETDEGKAARQVVEHLTGLGHRDILHISGGLTPCATARESGFRDAMTEAGLEPKVVLGDFTEEAGRTAMSGVLADGAVPTAIFAANDLVALGAMDVMQRAGLSVPGDVSIVGFDDMPVASLSVIELTTIRQNTDAMGRAAVSMLLDRVAGGHKKRQRVRLDGELVIRRTTGPAPKRRRKSKATS